MTDPGKNYPGQKGFPTPNDTPEETACIVFTVPASNDWSGLLLGAVKELLNPYNYYFWGVVTPEEAADKWNEIFTAAVNNNSCSAIVDAPYWEDESGDDADDEAPVDLQQWFGELQIIDDRLSFKDNLGIWIITAFVAAAATPAAAIAFLPFARKFVLTFQHFSLGGLVRILVDTVEIITVDTYSETDEARDVTIIMPEPAAGARAADPQTLWVEYTGEANPAVVGTASIRVIKKRLSEAEVSPLNLRYNEDCDCVEYSPDGGETWVRSDADDPRVGTKFIKPLKTGSDIRCRSAASMVKWMRDFIEYEAGILTAGAAIISAANWMLSFLTIIAPYAILARLVIDAAGVLFTIGGTALTVAFDEETWEGFLCILYCEIASDGSISESQLITIRTRIITELNTTAAIVLGTVLDVQGQVGLQNAGELYEVEEDCSDCECGWCHDEDFLLSDGGFEVDTWGGLAVYTAGIGWESADASGFRGMYIHKAFGATYNFTKIEMTYEGMSPLTTWVVAGNNGGGDLLHQSGAAEVGEHTVGWTGSQDISWIDFQGGNWVSSGSGGNFIAVHAHFEGIGESPYGADNC